MAAINANILDLVPNYGAKEIKVFIRKNTFNAFGITSFIFLAIFIAILFQIESFNSNIKKTKVISIGRTDLFDLVQEKPIDAIINVPKEFAFAGNVKERAGNPVPVPDAVVSPDSPDFADFGKMRNASADGQNSNGDPNISGMGIGLPPIEVNKPTEPEPDPNTDVFYEKMPSVDVQKLAKLVKYPDVAKQNGVEGTVLLRVLIDKSGEVKRVFVENSENLLLNQAAIDAIKSYGKFLPAIQNGVSVMCWVSIPIKFKLK